MLPVLGRNYNFQLKIKDFFAIVISETADIGFLNINKIDTDNNNCI